MMATAGQVRSIAIAQRQFGLNSRDACLGYVAAIGGHAVQSRKELSAQEANRVLDILEGQLAAEGQR